MYPNEAEIQLIHIKSNEREVGTYVWKLGEPLAFDIMLWLEVKDLHKALIEDHEALKP
jgi:hypothetical protein